LEEAALGEHRYAYIWADGIYLAAGDEPEKVALLCILGAREDGQKELLAMESGYRESTESWSEVLRNLRDRGLAPPLAAMGDGALGLWAALDQVFPRTEHQRFWNHRVLNIPNKLPNLLILLHLIRDFNPDRISQETLCIADRARSFCYPLVKKWRIKSGITL
jgi:transposase-like protein